MAAPGLAPRDKRPRAVPLALPHVPPWWFMHRGGAAGAGAATKPGALPISTGRRAAAGRRAPSMPPRCFAGTQSSVESAVRFSTAGLWRASPARPRRGAVLFTAPCCEARPHGKRRGRGRAARGRLCSCSANPGVTPNVYGELCVHKRCARHRVSVAKCPSWGGEEGVGMRSAACGTLRSPSHHRAPSPRGEGSPG